jgi:hypothetical protein
MQHHVPILHWEFQSLHRWYQKVAYLPIHLARVCSSTSTHKSILADSLLIDTLDECRKDICFSIRSSCSEQDVVGVPVDGQYSRPDRLLDVLGHPPVVLLVKRTNSDSPELISWVPPSEQRGELTWHHFQPQTCPPLDST